MNLELVVILIIPALILLGCAWVRFQPLAQLKWESDWNWLPMLGLCVLIPGSVFGHEFFNVSVITFDRLLLGGGCVWFVWRFLCSKESLNPISRMDVVIFVWLGVITLSTVTANFTVMGNMPLSRLLFFNWLPVFVYLLMRHSRMSQTDLKYILLGLGAFGIYLALTAVAEMRSMYALVQPQYIVTSEVREFFGRGRGPFLNPVANGTFLVVCLCCVLSWWPKSKSSARYFVAATGLVLCVGVYATLTRSNWLALVAGLTWFVFVPASPRAKAGMFVAAVLAGIALFPVVSDKIFSFKRDQDVSVADMEKSAQLRPMFAMIAWDMFQDRPLTGVGFGQYTQYKKPYLRAADADRPLVLTRPYMQHNVFLAYLTELGLLGVGVLLWLLIHSGRLAWRVWCRSSLALEARQWGLITLAFLSCYCINGMFHDTSIVPQMHILMMFVLGVVANIDSNRQAFAHVNVWDRALHVRQQRATLKRAA